VVPEKEWSVQVAAFPKLRDASALSDVLQQRGFTARVWGDKPPFRVRVGRYPTREEADAAVARMKGARINGVVVEAEKP
jgi:cell division protein FtsN